MELSTQQADALQKIRQWLDTCKPDGEGAAPIFRLFGYAGTGKTTIAKQLRTMVQDVRFATFTGKAALVLTQKGCEGASTIHRLIYKNVDKSGHELEVLKNQLEEARKANAPAAEITKLADSIVQAKKDLEQPSFHLNREAFTRQWDEDCERYVFVRPPDLIVIDECSMVDERMGHDLTSFGVPILVLGDPAQLPPVKGAGYFTNHTPDVLLTEIHRQAEGDPILMLATQVRSGNMALPMGQHGDSLVAFANDVPAEVYMQADQILCGTNKTRTAWNQRYREALGFAGFLPQIGEKVICLKNNYDAGVLNGSLWKVTKVEDFPNQIFFGLTVESLDEPGKTVMTRAWKFYFTGEPGPDDPRDLRDYDQFDYGYVITCHKSQGSQWEHVLIKDESRVFPKDREKWLYTAITRAAKRVTVVR